MFDKKQWTKQKWQIRPCKGIRIPELEKFLLVESGIEFKKSGIPLTIGIQNLSSTDKD